MFLLDPDDGLYRLPTRTFERLLDDPPSHTLPCFAASRVRLSEIAVELIDRQPVRVVWSTFDILVFDEHGRLDARAFLRHQQACAELGLMPSIACAQGAGPVIDATARFVVQGGCWTPSKDMLRRLGAAALGHLACPRLQAVRPEPAIRLRAYRGAAQFPDRR